MALTFLGIIAMGTVLLSLPAASRSGRSAGFLTSLFTATSATCVTGLVMGDTYSLWTPFGQAVILLMIQIGGLGFMSAASLAYFTLRRKIGMRSRLVMAEAMALGTPAVATNWSSNTEFMPEGSACLVRCRHYKTHLLAGRFSLK